MPGPACDGGAVDATVRRWRRFTSNRVLACAPPRPSSWADARVEVRLFAGRNGLYRSCRDRSSV